MDARFPTRSASTRLIAALALCLASDAATAKGLTKGFKEQGRFIGDIEDASVILVAIQYQDHDRFGLQANSLFGKPQFAIMASSLGDEGTPGRPIIVLSIDPVAPGDDTTYEIGEAQIVDKSQTKTEFQCFRQNHMGFSMCVVSKAEFTGRCARLKAKTLPPAV